MTLADSIHAVPNGAVLLGQALRDGVDGTEDLAVERWYGGTDRRRIVTVRVKAAGATLDSCATHIDIGARVVFFSGRDSDGAYLLGYCSQVRDPTSPEGRALEQEAARLLGPGQVPVVPHEPAPTSAPVPVAVSAVPTGPQVPGAVSSSPSGDPPVLPMGLGLAATALIGGLVVVARRDRRTRG